MKCLHSPEKEALVLPYIALHFYMPYKYISFGYIPFSIGNSETTILCFLLGEITELAFQRRYSKNFVVYIALQGR